MFKNSHQRVIHNNKKLEKLKLLNTMKISYVTFIQWNIFAH